MKFFSALFLSFSVFSASALPKKPQDQNANWVVSDAFEQKAPILVNMVDFAFDQLASLDLSTQRAFQNHFFTVLKTPSNPVYQTLNSCNSERKNAANFYKQKVQKLKINMNKDEKIMSVKQKSDTLKNWVKARLNNCAGKIGNGDLVTFTLEMAKAKVDARVDGMSDEEKLLIENKIETANQKLVNYKQKVADEAKNLVELASNKLESLLSITSQEVKDNLSELTNQLKDDIYSNWNSTWRSDLKDFLSNKWENEWSEVIEEKVNSDNMPVQIRSFAKWIFENVQDELEVDLNNYNGTEIEEVLGEVELLISESA